MIAETVFPAPPLTEEVIPEKEPLIGPSPNAFKHGCSSTGKVMTPRDKAKADRLFEMLCDTYEPETEYQEYLLQAIANALTLAERCQTISFALIDESSLAAQLHWDVDQSVFAEGLATRLPKAPGLVHLQLSQTPQGVAVLDDRWTRLGQALQDNGAWTDPQRSLALDLLGVPVEFRETGRTEVDARPGENGRAVAQAVVDRQLQKLRDRYKTESCQRFDDFRKDMAVLGAPVRITPEMRLMKRYEAMHIRRSNQLMAEFERVRGQGEDVAAEPKTPTTRFEAGLAGIYLKPPAAHPAAQSAAAAAHSVKPAPRVAPAAAAPAAPQAAAAPASSNGSAPKPTHIPQNRFRDREQERARKKAEREARKKARRQR